MEEDLIKEVRDFNRFYVRAIGLLERTILNSGYSLTEAHILQELHRHPGSTATSINMELHLDEGYLSRTIKKLVRQTLIQKEQSPMDKRAFVMSLTGKGREEYLKLDKKSSELVFSTIKHLNQNEIVELIELMDRIKSLLIPKGGSSEVTF